MLSLTRSPVVLVPGEPGHFESLPRRVRALGCEVAIARVPVDEVQLSALLHEVDVLAVSPRIRVTQEMVATASRLRGVVSLVIGVDNIDIEACTERGLVVANGAVPENYLGMAEATVMLMLVLLKDLKAKELALREGRWRPVHSRARLLLGKTVGLIGAGRIARGVAARLQGWQVKILGYDPYVPAEVMASAGIEPVSLEELLRRSDVVSLHVLLTPQTRGLVGARELSLMKPTAYLINTSRGGVVDEVALAEALREGRIAGAAIDVFEQEPPDPSNPLLSVSPERLVLTGHCVGHGAELGPALVDAVVENINRILRGEEPLYTVNPEVLPRWRERLSALEDKSTSG